MQKLLIISDTPGIKTGQARVVRELAQRFQKSGWDTTCGGWFDNLSTDRDFPYTVLPVDKGKQESLLPVLNKVSPNVVLAFSDPWNFKWLAENAHGFPCRLVGYLNIEAAPLPPHMERTLDGFDVITTTSEFGARVTGRPGVMAIHHGVDRSVFRKTGSRKALAGPPALDLSRTFVVLLTGQNVTRKNWPVAIQGYARFAKGKPDVFCYANTSLKGVDGIAPGHNLMDAVLDNDVQVMFNPANQGPLNTVGDAEMNAIYNLADVMLSTSAAEGFSLPLLEAMAVGVVPIAPDSFSATELLQDGRGFLMPVKSWFRSELGQDLAMMTPDVVAEALEEAYRKWKDGSLVAMRCAGMEFAGSRSWDRTFNMLEEAISQPVKARAADGQAIEPYIRMMGRRVVKRLPEAIGVMKLGGLGDMLQTTVVVREAVKKYGAPAVVFTNHQSPVFDGMGKDVVTEVVRVKAMSQDVLARSLADQFRVFLDVRYISWIYGSDLTPFAMKHSLFYKNWTGSCSRLATLGMHTTQLMLRSLGLRDDDITPVFAARDSVDGAPPPGFVAISTGAGAPLKQWPGLYWDQLVRKYLKGQTVVQVGGSDDQPVLGAKDFRGTTVAEMAWLLEQAAGLVTIEGGVAHLAAAVGTKTVVLYGPTDPVLFAYPDQVALTGAACPPCWWGPVWAEQACALSEPSCINMPTPAEVVSGLEKAGVLA